MNSRDPGVMLVAELHGLVGRLDELRALLAELAEATRREPRSTGFKVLASDEPGELVLLISWADESALREHYATPHYLRYREHVGRYSPAPATSWYITSARRSERVTRIPPTPEC